MALMNPSINFRQYDYIAADEWPQYDEDISNMLCRPAVSIFRQNAISRLFRGCKRKVLA
jgi:hypothetical protein